MLPRDVVRRLADAPVSPWRERDDPRPEDGFQALYCALYEATGRRGLPMPAGFLLDPDRIAARVALPRCHPWMRPVGLHPRFGLLHGGGTGMCSLHAVPLVAPFGPVQLPQVGPPRPFSRDWAALFTRLLQLEDALACAWVLRVRLHGADRWRLAGDPWGVAQVVDEAIGAQQLARLRRAAPEVVVAPLDDEVIVGCPALEAVAQILAFAGAESLLVLPDARGVRAGWNGAVAPAPAPAYCFAPPEPAHALIAELLPDALEPAVRWTMSQAPHTTAQVRVAAGRAVAPRTAILAGASPRLERYLGRHGCVQVAALRSLDGVRRFCATEPAADGWETTLCRIEDEAGGLLFSPAWGLATPDRLGPWLVLEDRATLEPLGLATYEDEAGAPSPERAWPFVQVMGQELAVIGLVQERCDSALCVDRDGVISFLDHEFGSLTAQATSVRGMLEKWALREELHDGGFGLAGAPAITAPVDVGPEFAGAFGLAAVDAACDAVSGHHLAAGAWLQRRVGAPNHCPQTWLHTRDDALAVRVARRLRELHPEVPIHLRIGVDPADLAREAAFAGAGISGLVRRTWWDWGAFPRP